MRLTGVVLLSGLVLIAGVLITSAQNRLPPDAPRPIDAADSLWAEELTSMEIRDALRAGTTTIIIGTGGVEQNGPYVAKESTTTCCRRSCHTSHEPSGVRCLPRSSSSNSG
jgi:hypothetical protein